MLSENSCFLIPIHEQEFSEKDKKTPVQLYSKTGGNDMTQKENQRGNAIMNNAELLVEIEKLLDRKLDEKLDKKLDEKLDKKLDEKLDAKFKEELGPIRQDIQELKTAVHHTNMRLDVDVVPRLQTIESCYLDTYERYKDGAEDIENLKGDMELVKGILQEHSRELQRMSAR